VAVALIIVKARVKGVWQQFAIQNIYSKSRKKIGKKEKLNALAGSFLPCFCF
jgi:hypothetical protein